MPHRLAVLAGLVMGGAPVFAQGLGEEGKVAEVTLIEGWRQADGTHVAALAFRLAPGWHTYWRVPGAAGIPPQFDWSGSENLRSVQLEWPRPKVYEISGIDTIGYADELILPMVLTPETPGGEITLDVSLFFGVCDEICVPSAAEVRGTLGPDREPQGRARIEAALADRPLDATAGGVASAVCTLSAGDDGSEITAEVTFDDAPRETQTAVNESARAEVWIGAAETQTDGRRVTATAAVEPGAGMDALVLSRDALRVTVLDDLRAVDIQGCSGAG